jgi:hypothetical protein
MLMEEPLSPRQKYLGILKNLAPAGAVGVSLMLGAAAPAAASTQPADAQPSSLENQNVSERLAAVRAAVSAVGNEQVGLDGDGRVAWWWRNFGFGGWPNWPNWRNWGNWWRNFY